MINNLNNNIYGLGSRLFALFFIYYAFAGNIIAQYAILLFFIYLFIGLIVKNIKLSFSVLEIFFIFILVFNILLAFLAPPKTSLYLISSCSTALVAALGIKLEKTIFNEGSNLATFSVWATGILILLIYISTFFTDQFIWLFEFIFYQEDREISQYESGALRFYTVAAVCFLIIPANRYRKGFSFFINLLPLSPVNALAWFSLHLRLRTIFILSVAIISVFFLSLYLYEGLMKNVLVILDFIEEKGLSLDRRREKLSFVNFIGARSGFDDEFSETYWIALAQGVGFFPAMLTFFTFFALIIRMSKNFFFIMVSLMLTVVNPFPLALIYLLAEAWNKENINVRKD